jgi:hypothetical protein
MKEMTSVMAKGKKPIVGREDMIWRTRRAS